MIKGAQIKYQTPTSYTSSGENSPTSLKSFRDVRLEFFCSVFFLLNWFDKLFTILLRLQPYLSLTSSYWWYEVNREWLEEDAYMLSMFTLNKTQNIKDRSMYLQLDTFLQERVFQWFTPYQFFFLMQYCYTIVLCVRSKFDSHIMTHIDIKHLNIAPFPHDSLLKTGLTTSFILFLFSNLMALENLGF